MGRFEQWWIRRSQGPLIRPWALLTPVVVLLLACPLIRPLFDPQAITPRQSLTLESVRSVLRHGTLVLDPDRIPDRSVAFYNGEHFFAPDSPVFSILLAIVSWVIERMGVGLDDNRVLHEYLLILLGIIFPTAMASGLIYRMARSFELSRLWRVVLALSSVLATGWFSYCTVLMPPALATALVVVAAASLWQVSRSGKPSLAVGWLAWGGFCSGLSTVIDPNTIWMLLLLPCVTLLLPFKVKIRLLGVLFILLGAVAPLVLHVTVVSEITGHSIAWSIPPTQTSPIRKIFDEPVIFDWSDDMDTVDPSFWIGVGRGLNRLILLTVGTHGILSHFPILLVAAVGIGMVLHRHWGVALKGLAGGIVLALIGQLGYRMFSRVDNQSFAAPMLLSLLPVSLLFAGAWLRKSHSPWVWTISGVALIVSVVITIAGATGPVPPGGFTGYTGAEAVEKLILSSWEPPRDPSSEVVFDRLLHAK